MKRYNNTYRNNNNRSAFYPHSVNFGWSPQTYKGCNDSSKYLVVYMHAAAPSGFWFRGHLLATLCKIQLPKDLEKKCEQF